MPIQAVAEHTVKSVSKYLLSTHRLHQSIDIMGHIPRIVSHSSFCNKLHTRGQILIIQPFSIGPSAVSPFCTGIDNMPPIACPCHENTVVICLPQGLCSLRNSIIIIGIFQSPAHLFMRMESFHDTVVQRDIAIFQITLHRTASLSVLISFSICYLKGILAHGIVGLFFIKISRIFHDSLSQGSRSVIANHCRSVAVPTRKYWKPAPFLIHINQTLHHSVGRWLDNQVQWQQSSIDIPHRKIHINPTVKWGIADFSHWMLHDFPASGERKITSVLVTEGTRQKTGTIQCTIELGNSSRVSRGNAHPIEFLLPTIYSA